MQCNWTTPLFAIKLILALLVFCCAIPAMKYEDDDWHTYFGRYRNHNEHALNNKYALPIWFAVVAFVSCAVGLCAHRFDKRDCFRCTCFTFLLPAFAMAIATAVGEFRHLLAGRGDDVSKEALIDQAKKAEVKYLREHPGEATSIEQLNATGLKALANQYPQFSPAHYEGIVVVLNTIICAAALLYALLALIAIILVLQQLCFGEKYIKDRRESHQPSFLEQQNHSSWRREWNTEDENVIQAVEQIIQSIGSARIKILE